MEIFFNLFSYDFYYMFQELLYVPYKLMYIKFMRFISFVKLINMNTNII